MYTSLSIDFSVASCQTCSVAYFTTLNYPNICQFVSLVFIIFFIFHVSLVLSYLYLYTLIFNYKFIFTKTIKAT